MISTITVNTHGAEYEYTKRMGIPTIETLKAVHPNWTSMVITIVNTEAKQ